MSGLSSKAGILLYIVVLAYCKVFKTVLFHDGYINNTSGESQIDFDLLTPQLIQLTNH